ncbi:MAG TPA: hypothetical protein VHB21_01180 [Minicystis sp.]|nr:hypothetical protein [Minicystis sp.]
MTPRFAVRARLAVPLAVVFAASGAGCSSNGNGAGGATSSGSTAASTQHATSSTGAGAGGSGGGGVDAGASVLTMHARPTRDGVYADAAFTKAAAKGLHLDASFSATVDGDEYAQLLYFDAKGAGKDLVIASTEHDSVYALDAATGAVVWKTSVGAYVPKAGNLQCGNIDPYGITGTPVIDYASKTLYVAANVLEAGEAHQRVFALSLADGSAKAGWPVEVADVAKGSDPFDSSAQGQRGGLLLADGTVYVPYGGLWGDCGVYHGWVIGIPTADPKHPHAWPTKARGGGIWAPGGPSWDGQGVYVATGNTFGAQSWQGGDAIVRLSPSVGFDGKSFFAPSNWPELDANDVDLGGSGPLVVDLPSGPHTKLVVALGKDGNVYLVDRGHMGGVGGQVAGSHVADNEIIGAAAAYATKQGTYVVFKGKGADCPSGQGDLVALRVTGGGTATAWCATQHGTGSPMVTQTPSGDTLVWGVGAEGDGRLHAFDGDTGKVVFAGGGASDQMGSVDRYVSPIAAKGRIFVGGSGAVYAFKP